MWEAQRWDSTGLWEAIFRAENSTFALPSWIDGMEGAISFTSVKSSFTFTRDRAYVDAIRPFLAGCHKLAEK
jgi:hypothetical protein